MSNRHPAADGWKVVPCHFIWKLEENVHVDFKGVVNNIDSKLETRNEIEWKESACDMLLFRGYIEVSDFQGVERNPQKAEEFFLEAEKEAMKVTDDDERQAYITVATANRLWVLDLIEEGNQSEGRRSRLIDDLEASWGRVRDKLCQDKLVAFIDAIAAFALARLGPNKYKEAERRYQRALKTIQSKSWWYQSLGAVIGRQGRLMSDNFKDQHEGIHDEIQCYEKAIELDPQNSSAKCDLAMVLLRFPEREDEARDLINDVEEHSCEIILKKGRFYRRVKEFGKALEVLLNGETRLQRVRSELYFQIACLYQDLSNQATREGNWNEKLECDRKETRYLDKCLELEASHFNGMIKKGIALSKARRNEEGVVLLRRVIEMYRYSPRNLIEAQNALAGTLFIQNNKRCNEEVASAYEAVVDTGVHILINIDIHGNKKIRYFVDRAKDILERYYANVDGGAIKAQTLRNKFSEIGVDG